MAIDNVRRYGFRWMSSISGMPNPKPIRGYIATAYAPTVGATAVNLNVGDPVLRTTDGTFIKAIGTEGTAGQVYGIIEGFGPRFDGFVMQPTNKYVTGTTYGNVERQTVVYVRPVEGQIFEVDCSAILSGATSFTSYRAVIGENANMVLTADTTDASNPKMTPQLDIATHAATATLFWRIEDVSQTMDNVDYTGNYVKLYVTINVTQQSPFTALGI